MSINRSPRIPINHPAFNSKMLDGQGACQDTVVPEAKLAFISPEAVEAAANICGSCAVRDQCRSDVVNSRMLDSRVTFQGGETSATIKRAINTMNETPPHTRLAPGDTTV